MATTKTTTKRTIVPASPIPPARSAKRQTPNRDNASNESSRHERIAALAYTFAQQNGFQTDPVQDWLAAERMIDANS